MTACEIIANGRVKFDPTAGWMSLSRAERTRKRAVKLCTLHCR
jgi:hypothetical protein